MFEISVAGKFIATHQLRLADATLEAPHEHEWRVLVTFAGPNLDRNGLLLDFEDIRRRLNDFLAILFDRNLNDLPAFAALNPSAENVAKHIADQMGGLLPEGVQLTCVQIEEASGCFARYIPDR